MRGCTDYALYTKQEPRYARSRPSLAIHNIDRNNTARERLISQLQTGRSIGCIGAGVSACAGYRTWNGVIDRLAAEVELRRPGQIDTRAVIRLNTDLLLCAKRLGSDLGEPGFTNFIRTEFGPKEGPLPNVLLQIAALPLRHALTLNFDHSYEYAHTLHRTTCRTISSGDPWALARFLQQMDDSTYPKHAVHLHGKYDDPINSIVLTEDGYAELYGNNALFRKFVWTMSATKHFLFLGFGFTDTDFTGILRDCAREANIGEPHHHAVVGLTPDQDDNQVRILLNDRYAVDPIFYNVLIDAGGQSNHDEFVGVINALSAALGVPESIPTSPLQVVSVRATPADPEDQRRVDELADRMLRRIDPGGDGV
jgi:hypothetical protein